MVSNKELRQNARQQLGGNIFAKAWLMVLLVCFIVTAITSATSAVFIGPIIVTGPLTYGLYRILQRVVKNNEEVDFSNLFVGFTENFVNSLLLYLIETIFTLLWALLFIIPGIVKYYSYSMSLYIQQQSDNKDWSYCHQKSISLMDGYKMKLFLLDLSFIGWYILGSLLFGVGMLFVIPYHYTARVNFFEAVIAEKGL